MSHTGKNEGNETGAQMMAMAIDRLKRGRKARSGDKVIVQTSGGGYYSGERRFVLYEQPEVWVRLPKNSILRFEDDVEVIGSIADNGVRSPGGTMDKDDRYALCTREMNEDGKMDCLLFFIHSNRGLWFHYIHPGQIATVLRIGVR